MSNVIYMGIDGEGVEGHTVNSPHHKYVLLAAVTEDGERRYAVENPNGLSTKECLRFIVNLPRVGVKIFGYSLNYDWTKILADIDDAKLYLLFRPELRQPSVRRKHGNGPRPIYWQGYTLNMQGTKFVIEYGSVKMTIWDIWKFYQSKFVGALKDWKVGDEELWSRMGAMKNRRSTFAPEDMPEVREYCYEECAKMGELAHKLVDAHKSAGLKLTSFYGAGSSATALLKTMRIRSKIKEPPPAVNVHVASAFSGGRFENNWIGEIDDPCVNNDISSAYPYQSFQLPCLMCGQWEHVTDRKQLDTVKIALVHYGMNYGAKCENWAPFPYRDDTGSICYPKASPGGWVWRDEYLAGEAGWGEMVEFRDAWIYKCDCEHRPFEAVPQYYRERIRIGKEGAGMVYKLALSSIYGKLAQSVGNGIFQCWVWAGLITSGCRAQLLRLMGSFRHLSDVLMVATDGLLSKVGVPTETPIETGTSECMKDGKPVPLGGWEEDRKSMRKGVFIARPGIYFPIQPTKDDIKKIKGRGIGTGIVLSNYEHIIEAWRRGLGDENVIVAGVERFCGAKTSIHYAQKADKFSRASGEWSGNHRTAPAYGEWIVRQVDMSFNPMPKRARILPGHGWSRKLELRVIDRNAPESRPYSKATLKFDPNANVIIDQETVAIRKELEELGEQPDLDYSPI
jgi:hypothetical protein